MSTTLTSGQLGLQLKMFDEKGMTPSRWNQILSSGLFADLCDSAADLGNREAFRAALKLGVALPETIRITVDYGQTLEAMIAAGSYDSIDRDITPARFQMKGNGIVEYECELMRFDQKTSSGQATKRAEKDGWQASGIEHLLAFGAKYPEEQWKYPIAALGSIAEDRDELSDVAYLSIRGARRYLGFGYRSSMKPRRWRYLAVRQVSEP